MARLALNNRLVVSDDFLTFPVITFDPVGEEEEEGIPLAALPTELLFLLR